MPRMAPGVCLTLRRVLRGDEHRPLGVCHRVLDHDSAAERLLVVQNPISVGGRVLDVFMEIYAITVIAALAGAFGSFLQKRGQEMEAKR
jgi:hypothetical protein